MQPIRHGWRNFIKANLSTEGLCWTSSLDSRVDPYDSVKNLQLPISMFKYSFNCLYKQTACVNNAMTQPIIS